MSGQGLCRFSILSFFNSVYSGSPAPTLSLHTEHVRRGRDDLALERLDHWTVRISKCEVTHCPSFREPSFQVGQDFGVVSLEKGVYSL